MVQSLVEFCRSQSVPLLFLSPTPESLARFTLRLVCFEKHAEVLRDWVKENGVPTILVDLIVVPDCGMLSSADLVEGWQKAWAGEEVKEIRCERSDG